MASGAYSPESPTVKKHHRRLISKIDHHGTPTINSMAPPEKLAKHFGFDSIFPWLVHSGSDRTLALNFSFFCPYEKRVTTHEQISVQPGLPSNRVRHHQQALRTWNEMIKNTIRIAMAWIRKWFEQRNGENHRVNVVASLNGTIFGRDVGMDDMLRKSNLGRQMGTKWLHLEDEDKWISHTKLFGMVASHAQIVKQMVPYTTGWYEALWPAVDYAQHELLMRALHDDWPVCLFLSHSEAGNLRPFHKHLREIMTPNLSLKIAGNLSISMPSSEAAIIQLDS